MHSHHITTYNKILKYNLIKKKNIVYWHKNMHNLFWNGTFFKEKTQCLKKGVMSPSTPPPKKRRMWLVCVILFIYFFSKKKYVDYKVVISVCSIFEKIKELER